MKKYYVLHYYYPKDGAKLEDMLNDGWKVERADMVHGNGLVYILSKEE
jgi:hypothetical protein